MARKDFEEYYGKIKDQYFRTIHMLEELGEEAGEKPLDPQVLENLQKILEPVKNSYLQLAYIEYLLNLPKDKTVRVRNSQQFEAQLNKIDNKVKPEVVLSKNESLITEAAFVAKEG